MAFLGAAHFFYSWAAFGFDYIIFIIYSSGSEFSTDSSTDISEPPLSSSGESADDYDIDLYSSGKNTDDHDNHSKICIQMVNLQRTKRSWS